MNVGTKGYISIKRCNGAYFVQNFELLADLKNASITDMEPEFVNQETKEKLEAELHYLKTVERPKIVK